MNLFFVNKSTVRFHNGYCSHINVAVQLHEMRSSCAISLPIVQKEHRYKSTPTVYIRNWWFFKSRFLGHKKAQKRRHWLLAGKFSEQDVWPQTNLKTTNSTACDVPQRLCVNVNVPKRSSKSKRETPCRYKVWTWYQHNWPTYFISDNSVDYL